MSKFVGVIVGGLELIGGIILVATGVGAALGALLITAGIGTLLKGVGTLISGSGGSSQSQTPGYTTTSRNPISPWMEGFGRFIIGGTVVHINEFGDSDKYIDIVIVLVARPSQSVDKLLFDGQPVQLSQSSGVAFNGAANATTVGGPGTGDSFTPLQQTVNITSTTRINDVVTVVLSAAIPLLAPGDKIIVQNITGDHTLNGTFPVESVGGGGTTFIYINGGNPASVGAQGQAKTLWPDYGRKVHMEVLLGDHSATFPGMLNGTAFDGDTTNPVQYTSTTNPWTAAHKLLGKCAVFLRLHYNDTYFSGGLPQISFLMRGAKDVYDPRLGAFGSPGTTAYTENAALCIADYLSNTSYGFKAAYGTEIPTTPLIAAANICDEAVALAIGGTEPRYALNGKFDLTIKRGEVLQNMLTACAGRLTYSGGQFIIWPAAWNGSTPAPAPSMGQMSGPFRWKSTVSIRDLYNGVKGTYICPANNWQASDIPPYAQDTTHGYGVGAIWSGSASYVIGNVVLFGGVGYIALAAGSGHQPDSSPSFWSVHYQDINLITDGGDRRWLDIQLPFTISAATAQRLCKIELMRRRRQGTGTFRYNMAGYGITTMDVISMTIPYMGWSNKLFEVLAHRFTLDKQSADGNEVTLLGTEIDVQETDSAVFDWVDTEELTPQGYQQPAVPDARTPAPPTGLTLLSDESTTVVTPQGLADSILVTWTEPTDGYVLNGGHIEIQYELIEQYAVGTLAATNGSVNIVGTGTVWTFDMDGETIAINGVPYAIGTVIDNTHMTLATNFLGATGAALLYVIAYSSAWIGLPSVNASVTQVVINGVADGEQYNVQIRSVNAGGTPSPWVAAGPVTATGARQPYPLKPWVFPYAFAPAGYQALISQDGAVMSVSAWPPPNVTSPLLAAPVLAPNGVVTPLVGATMPLGDWIAVLFCLDTNGMYSAASEYSQFSISAAAQSVAFTATMPALTAKYELFIGRNPESLVSQGVSTGTAVTIPRSSIVTTGYGPPDPRFDHFHVRAKRIIHAGVFIANVLSKTVFSVGRPIRIFIGMPSGASFTTDQWLGYEMTLVRNGRTVLITGNDTGGGFSGSGFAQFNVGDAVLIRTKADTFSNTTIGDSNFANVFYPTGMVVDDEADYLVRIIGGTGAGQPVKRIIANTGTVLTIDAAFPFYPVPDATSTFIVEEHGWTVSYPTTPISVATMPSSNINPPVIAQFPIGGLGGYVALVQILTSDANGNDAPETLDAISDVYVAPPASGPIATPYMVPVVAGVATPDASQGLNLLVLTAANTVIPTGGTNPQVTVAQPVNYSTATGQNTAWSLTVQQDPVGLTGGYSVVFDATYAVDFGVSTPQSPANTQSHVDMRTSAAGNTVPTSSLLNGRILV